MPEPLAAFRGAVSCTRSASVPALTLRGYGVQPPGGETVLAFSATSLPDLPDTLQDAVVEQLNGGQYRIVSAANEWLISAGAVHLHREVATEFYRAIPPRPAPWRKRLFWRAVLALAASSAGIAALRALRR
jgi:hypothetical protein